jgi:ABC-2 type transport system permease protein
VGGVGRAVDIPGFPKVDGFLDFMLAGAMIQGCLMAGNSGAIAFAIDMEMGFTDRLMAAPISRFAIVLGRLAGTALLGAIIAVYFIAIGLIFGASISEGVLGAVWIVVVVSASALAFGSIGVAIALRTGTASVVQGLFPLLFVILFLSDAFFPINLLLEPSQTIANVNPLSFMVDGLREPIISSFSLGDSLAAVASVIGITAIGMALCAAAIRGRARRGG